MYYDATMCGYPHMKQPPIAGDKSNTTYSPLGHVVEKKAMFKFSVDKSEFIEQMTRVSERNFEPR